MSCKHRWTWDDRPYKVCTYCGIEPDEEEQRERERLAYRKGAEAMRAQILNWLARAQEEATVVVVDTAIRGVHKLSIPEER